MTDTDNGQSSDDCLIFPVDDIVQYPLPGYAVPSSIAFSPDDKLISYLFSADSILSRKIFAFDPGSEKQQMLVSPPGGGFDEINLSTAEKLRRDRLRERGLGVTRYEWSKSSQSPRIMVLMPNGIYFQDAPGSELRLRLPVTSRSPIIDPQLSPDGTMTAFVRDDEIYVMPVSYGEPKQITYGARGGGKLDNRGSARRGLKFEGALKYHVGRIDVDDQETGAKWLVKQGLAKPGRIGIYGWSYGGYMAAMAIGRYPETFKCAVSGAPVTAWDGYDTFYTEKYMGMPSDNPAGYDYSSLMHHVHGIKGKLLLVHGMIDENVHFRHTARLVNALIAAGKGYELLLFPDERHTLQQLRDRMYMEERIWEFIDRNL